MLAVAAVVAACFLPLSAKTNVTFNEYKLAEVTADGVNIRSGAGVQYPLAYTYMTDASNRQVKMDAPELYKGCRLWVKDAGDWWEIRHNGTVDGDSRRFIMKKQCKLIETDCFDTDSITEPQVWALAQKMKFDEDSGEMLQTVIVTIYPGGLAVTQLRNPEGDNILIGAIKKDKTAVFYSVSVSVGTTGDEPAPTTLLKIWVEPGYMPPMLMWEIGSGSMEHFDWNGEQVEYVDLSGIAPEKWRQLVAELRSSEHFRAIRQYRSDPEAYFISSDLSAFRRIK